MLMRAEHWLQLSGGGIKLKKWDPFERRALGAGSPTHLGFHPFFCSVRAIPEPCWPWGVSASTGSCSAAFSGMWGSWGPLTRLCITEEWHRWSTLVSPRGFWGLTQGSRGRCLPSGSFSSSAAGTPASDKSICPLSISWQDNFAASGQHRWCVNFACCFCWLK